MQISNKYKYILLPLLLFNIYIGKSQNILTQLQTVEDGIVRGGIQQKKIALVFTGDEWFEGFPGIIQDLHEQQIRAGFFLTGRMYRNPEARPLIRQAFKSGHYLGPHSDRHLLYNDWTKRDSLLVSRDSMLNDLQQNIYAMKELGIGHHRKLFIPPYEWWNKEVAKWSQSIGWQVISFTPGTFTNADYTTPEMGTSYRSSDTLLQRLFRKESSEGLNGAILLIHVGTDPERTDKLYDRLPMLINTMRQRGYQFVRIDELFK